MTFYDEHKTYIWKKMRYPKLDEVGLELIKLPVIKQSSMCFDVTSRVDKACATLLLEVLGRNILTFHQLQIFFEQGFLLEKCS